MEQKLKPSEKPHYVNNAQFSAAVVEYVKEVNAAKERGAPEPQIPNYIAECFMKIAEGLSHKSNFLRYTYREEMVMDAVEDCLKRIKNYNIDTKTRTGKPNAFGYFTQISWYAFLRRIKKEKREEEIRYQYMTESGLEQLLQEEIDANPAARQTQAYVEELRERIESVRDPVKSVDKSDKNKVRSTKRTRKVDSDLTSFMD